MSTMLETIKKAGYPMSTPTGPLTTELWEKALRKTFADNFSIMQNLVPQQSPILQAVKAGKDVTLDNGDRVFIRRSTDTGHEYWLTRDGRYLALKEMESDHIQRCIGRIFRSRVGWRASYLPFLQAELDRRENAKPLECVTLQGS